jgi:predicted nucleic acid-binding protein
METLIIDASVAIKWVVQEDGTDAAIGLRQRFRFAAPDFIVAECSNIIWKKVQRGELARQEAIIASRLLQQSDVELFSMRPLFEEATTLAIDLGHPAYDCVYLALARQIAMRFVTADKRLLQTITEKSPQHAKLCVSLDQAYGVAGLN